MIVVFDVDGVLVDTHDHVVEAYRRAGIVMPEDAWHRPWKDWLPQLMDDDLMKAHFVHAQKNLHYLEVLNETPPKILPAGRMVQEYRASALMYYAVSSGSDAAIRAVLAKARLNVPLLGTQLSPHDRYGVLKSFEKPGVYVDDNEFETPTGWSFVRYTEQSYHRLVEAIWRAGDNGVPLVLTPEGIRRKGE